MKNLWTRTTARVNAMSVRERLLLFGVVVALLGALIDAMFVTPLTRLQKQRAQQIEQRSASMEGQRQRIEAQLAESRRTHAAELNAEIARIQQAIDATEREIAVLSAGARDAAALRGTLTRALGRGDKVALLRVTTAEGAAAPAAGAGLPSGVGLDFALGGRYLDLMDRLAELESALPQARWGALRFTAETVPAQVAVRIVTPREAP